MYDEELFPRWPHDLTQRRFLPGNPPVWVDDEHSCQYRHTVYEDRKTSWSGWHRYRDKNGRDHVIRCPSTLKPSERAGMLEDIPPGAWAKKIRERGD